MKSKIIPLFTCFLLGFVRLACAQENSDAPLILAVDSPAFVFSPANWAGDDGRGGKGFRQTWNTNAYFRVSWESGADPAPTLLLDTTSYEEKSGAPLLAYCLDGIWSDHVACAKEIPLNGARAESGRHTLTVFLESSPQKNRWGSQGVSASNVVRVAGLRLGAGARAVPGVEGKKWALVIGDSITEGTGANDLEGYSYLVGEALRARGYEYGVSACGWSGWLNRGDNPPGDVPGYYVVSESLDGAGGHYDEALSRWNKIDANHSLLDAAGRISAHGAAGEEPALIMINYGTNDVLWKQNESDVRASMAGCLAALRKAAPEARIVFLIPFGQYKAADIKATVEAFLSAHPAERRVSILDLGADTARAIAKKGFWGDLHPNARGHAVFAAQITAQLLALPDAPAGR